MTKQVLIVLAQGCEEIEATTPIDVLRRAGLEVTIAGIGGLRITGSHGITLEADTTLEALDGLPEAIVLPGGMPGAENLANSEVLNDILEKMHAQGRTIGAICAAPAVVLAATGILDGRNATCYPGFEARFSDAVNFREDRVVIDGNLITSRGPGTALEFSLALASRLADPHISGELGRAMLMPTRPRGSVAT